jgi:hypothetical protein
MVAHLRITAYLAAQAVAVLAVRLARPVLAGQQRQVKVLQAVLALVQVFLVAVAAAAHLLLARLVKILAQALAVRALHLLFPAPRLLMRAVAAVGLIPQHHPVARAAAAILELLRLGLVLLALQILAVAVVEAQAAALTAATAVKAAPVS